MPPLSKAVTTVTTETLANFRSTRSGKQGIIINEAFAVQDKQTYLSPMSFCRSTHRNVGEQLTLPVFGQSN